MTSKEEQLLAFAAQKVAAREEYMAYSLTQYQQQESLTENELADLIGCSSEAYYRLALCRAPDPQVPDFEQRVQRIASYVDASPVSLAQVIQHVAITQVVPETLKETTKRERWTERLLQDTDALFQKLRTYLPSRHHLHQRPAFAVATTLLLVAMMVAITFPYLYSNREYEEIAGPEGVFYGAVYIDGESISGHSITLALRPDNNSMDEEITIMKVPPISSPSSFVVGVGNSVLFVLNRILPSKDYWLALDSDKNDQLVVIDALPSVSTSNVYATILGFSNGAFRPDHNITRGEAALFVSRQLLTSTYDTYSDVVENHWAATYIESLCETGIIRGTEIGHNGEVHIHKCDIASFSQGQEAYFIPQINLDRAALASFLVETVTPDNNTWAYKYDIAGNLIAVKSSLGYTSSHEYDTLNRLIYTSDNDGNTWIYEYDAVGNVVKKIDTTGTMTYNEYDLQGRIIRMIDHSGNHRVLEYDDENCLTTVTHLGQSAHMYNYDPLGTVKDQSNQVQGLDEYIRTDYSLDTNWERNCDLHVPTDKTVIQRASLLLKVQDVSVAIDQLQNIISSQPGISVDIEETGQADQGNLSTIVSIQVPTYVFEETLAQLKALGTDTISERIISCSN